MAQPWASPPERFDLQAAAGVLVQLSQGKDTSILLNAVAPGETTVLDKGTLMPPALVNVTEDYLLIAVSGTQNWLQWVCHFLGSSQQAGIGYPGMVNQYFASVANDLLTALADFIPLLATRRLVVFGHSFGAAIVQLVAVKLQEAAVRGSVCYCFGGPRVGNPDFVAGTTNPPYRVQHDGDVVPSFPPTTWAGIGTPWTGFGGLIPATYAHAGVVISLDDLGETGTRDNTMSFQDAVGVAAAQKFDPHAVEEYQRLLQLIFEPPTGTTWADPLTVEEILSFEAIFFTPGSGVGGAGMALIQGIMYFRTSEQVWGWGESFVGNTDITNMLTNLLPALAPTRARILANTCEIFAYKASNIDPARARNQSKSVILDTPVPGKGQGTNIKNPDTTATNILMDCLDYELLSAGGSRRIFPFRGVPDNWIQASKRTGDGIAGDKPIQTFFTTCTQQGLGFKIYQRANAQNPIQAIAPDPISGLLTITFPGHALQNRQLVTIRALKPNPMVNGKWRVLVKDANNFQLVGSNKFNVTAFGAGTWQLFSITPDTIASADFNGVSTRKVGKAFGQRRGKQSARLLHH